MKPISSFFLKQKALELGFNFVGISKAEFLESEAAHLEAWLHKGMAGNMEYMHRNFDIRLNPCLLVEGAKTVISLGYNYYPNQTQPNLDAEHNLLPQISRYAYNTDYHFVIKDKLKTLLLFLQQHTGTTQPLGRGFVDSAPILERAWAKRAGIGWIGKNGMLITRQAGSFFFLAEIITEIELTPDPPFQKDYCGNCTRCINACPTQAITNQRIIDGSKCISYLTIELKNHLPIPPEMEGKTQNWIFGCDICQEVCPWNRFATPHTEPLFEPKPQFFAFSQKDWLDITQPVFNLLFKNSALKRTGYKGLQRNLKFWQQTQLNKIKN